MSTIHTEETRITVTGRNALGEMIKRRVSLHPTNYAVWYEYCVGQNEGLMAALDGIIKSAVPLTNELHDYLYDKYFINKQGQEVTHRVGDEMQSVLKNIGEKLLTVAKSSVAYQDKLGQYSAQLHNAKSPSDILTAIEFLIRDTNAMASSSRDLQHRLEKESAHVESLRSLLEQTRHEALTDPLTGLYNRKALDKKTQELLTGFRTTGITFSVLMLDVDFFKKFNDEYGHVIGDAVLRAVANTIAQHVKGADFAARYGGEEFVVFLPNTPLEKSLVVAEHIRADTENARWKLAKTNQAVRPFTLSVGITEARPNDSSETLFDRADKALYAAKHSGRNTVRTAS